jgi:hypothetical protein
MVKQPILQHALMWTLCDDNFERLVVVRRVPLHDRPGRHTVKRPSLASVMYLCMVFCEDLRALIACLDCEKS